MAEHTLAQLVEAYIKCRDRKKAADDEHKAKMKPLSEFMEQLDARLTEALTKAGADSFATAFGTVYKRIETSVSIEDAEKFEAWRLEQPDDSACDIKPNKTAIKAMLERGEQPPPGIKVTQIALVGVQRK